MKKFNKNIILFVLASVFVLSGFFGDFFNELKTEFFVFKDGLLSGNIYSIFDFKSKLDALSQNELLYRYNLMDLNSVKENLIGTKGISKDDITIVKTESGKLAQKIGKTNEESLDETISKIKNLEIYSKNRNIGFLYVTVPIKECFEKNPSNFVNYAKENREIFVRKLDLEKLTYLSIFEDVPVEKISDFYFDTDHHWIPEAGFLATREICEKLGSLYGFDYNDSYLDINNYNVTVYKDYFLGSYGKKVGSYFTFKGADDFSLITPKFSTDLTEVQPFKNQTRNGSFEQTFLFLDNVETKDYYKFNTYATYSGGDFRLQIMKNNLNTTGKKILIVRDSFACVVTPFLALQTSELHIVDLRNYLGYVGEKINVYDYIEEIKPDYVVVFYGSVSPADLVNDKFKFD